jgi:arylformamidase
MPVGLVNRERLDHSAGMTAAVFRTYDQAELDRQYNNRARVPDFQRYLDRWRSASESARTRLPCRLDVAYGSGPRDRLDLFPSTRPGGPLLIFIHGGYWQALDQKSFSYVAEPWTQRGVAYAAVTYPLAPDVGMGAIVDRVRQAVAWLHREASAFGYDAGRIVVAGHSAGGHLAAMMLATDWEAAGLGPRDLLKGAIALSGLYDLEPIRLCYLNKVLAMDAETAARQSPVNLRPRADARAILAVGGDESEDYHRQLWALAAAWSGYAGELRIHDRPGRNHFSIVDDLAEPDGRVFQEAAGLLGVVS